MNEGVTDRRVLDRDHVMVLDIVNVIDDDALFSVLVTLRERLADFVFDSVMELVRVSFLVMEGLLLDSDDDRELVRGSDSVFFEMLPVSLLVSEDVFVTMNVCDTVSVNDSELMFVRLLDTDSVKVDVRDKERSSVKDFTVIEGVLVRVSESEMVMDSETLSLAIAESDKLIVARVGERVMDGDNVLDGEPVSLNESDTEIDTLIEYVSVLEVVRLPMDLLSVIDSLIDGVKDSVPLGE